MQQEQADGSEGHKLDVGPAEGLASGVAWDSDGMTAGETHSDRWWDEQGECVDLDADPLFPTLSGEAAASIIAAQFG